MLSTGAHSNSSFASRPGSAAQAPPMYTHVIFERKWNEALEIQRKRLDGKKYSSQLQQLTYDSFKVALETADRNYSDRQIAKYTQKLLPTLESFNTFSVGITSLVQASGDSLAGYVWGTLQVVLVLASRFGKLLSLISEMIEDLTSTLIRLENYMGLFPDSQALLSCISCLIDDYVGFCISAYKFFIRWPPMYSLLRLHWSAIDYKFNKAKQNITRNIEAFDRTRQLLVDTTVVHGTRAIQAALPVIEIQPIQPESFYDVPYTRNPFFCGRDETLKALHDHLNGMQDPKTAQRACVIHGLGGIGKTQVSVEYTFRYRSEYQFIFWVRAETAPELRAGVERIAHSLNLANGVNPIDSFKKWLEKTNKRWLLVFDNAQDWGTLSICWPCSTHGSVILTAQNPEFSQVTTLEIPLRPMGDAEGASLLLKHLRDENSTEEQQKHAKAISDELGGLPLAIAHIAGYLSQSKTPLLEFLEQFSERVNSAVLFRMDAPLTTFQYEKTLGVVWDVALQRLSSDALQLIQILSMMNPDGVPEDMLYGDHEAACLEFLKSPNKMRFHEMIRVLRAQQLVSRKTVSGSPCLSMHRSLQRSILHRLDDDYERFQQTFDMAFTLIRRKFPKQSAIHMPQSDVWGACELYRPHVMNLRGVYVRSKRRPQVSIRLAEMLSDAGYYFYDRGIYHDGILASDTAEEIIANFPIGNLVLRANVYTVASVVRWDRGMSERRKMLQCFLKCLSLRQQHVNELDVDADQIILYSNAWNDMGLALADYECSEDAVACYDLSTQIKNKAGHAWAWLESERNKAQALAGMGRYEEAVACIVKDEDFPVELTASTSSLAAGAYPQHVQYMFANVLLNAGELDQAREIFLEVLERRKVIFGKTARETLSTYYMLAVIQQKKGNLPEAVALLRKALEKPGNWSEELRAQAQNRLAQLLELMGDLGEARCIRALAETVRRRVWKEHGEYIPKHVRATDEQVYDHIAPLECGRSTVGAFQQFGKFPKLMEICQILKKRLDDAGKNPVGPCEVAAICKLDAVAIQEEEGFC